MNNFVHLHLHTEYSLLDGACRIKRLISKARDMGFKSIAITDHGVMYGVIDFYKEAKKNGIKPIIGCEVYVSPRSRFDKVHELDSESRHLVLLCKNHIGYTNLIKMVSLSYTEGFYNKPRVDEELLQKYSDGLIALSACLAGEIPRALVNNDYEKAKSVAIKYENIFGKGNFYIEIQNHGIDDQKKILPLLIKLSKETNIPLVATNDCHYIDKEDAKLQDTLLCIQTNHYLSDENRFAFETDEFYLKSYEEMKALFSDVPEAISNTLEIADKCNLDFEFGNTQLPHFEVPNNEDHFEYFKRSCYKGLLEKYGPNPDKSIKERLDYELNVIKNMGYIDYFLIVHDFVRYAKSVNIPVGPGRGSGAGSLAAYCIGITGIDPLKYNLLFERFLNPERVSMPDFDIDFCYERRQEVIDYVVNKYGANHVSQIVTFGTMAARAAIRDVGRVMGIPFSTVDAISRMVPTEIGMTIDKALNSSPELKEKYASDNQIKELIELAKKIEGMPRQASTHAAGVVITKNPVDSYVPLAKNGDFIVTQYTMTTLEELGLLKMDFLGLRTLTVLSYAEKFVKKSNPEFSLNEIPDYDKDVFNMISSGKTDGVFQFESSGMKSVLTQLKPENLEDLIAVISLYRPGPMDSIPKYIQNRHNPSKVTYIHKMMEPILRVTYGCIVYQEQVMQIFRTLAGYSLGRADIVRRAMSKKKHDVMEKERQIFINGLVDKNGNIEVEGCIRRGVSEEIAKQIFDDMESFASYAFNKSHAAAYAFVSYQTAYMKCKYPKEFMAALLTSVLDDSKINTYISECLSLGIKVLPPNINESFSGFTVSGENISFGLLAIKSIGKVAINNLIEERENNGKFKSFYDFCKRCHKYFNNRVIENLIKCGALDCLDVNRRQMLSVVSSLINSLNQQSKINLEGQIGFFDDMSNESSSNLVEFPKVEEFSAKELLSMEKSTTGMYLSGHPLFEYEAVSKNMNLQKISDLVYDNRRYQDGDFVSVLCIINKVTSKTTKNNSLIAFLQIEDTTSSIEVIAFSNALAKYSHLIGQGKIVKISGKLSSKEDEEPKIICEEIIGPEEFNNIDSNKDKINSSKSMRNGLYLKVPSKESFENKRAELLLSIFEGTTPVYIYYMDTKKLMKAPISMWVTVNKPLLKELRNQLGEKNVALVGDF